MKNRLFGSFSSMIASIPVSGIPGALELEYRMLEDDLMYKRISDTEEVVSVLSFCRFIRAVADGSNILPVELPNDHVVFYREVVIRLVEAGELPANAIEQFSRTFPSGFLKILSNN
jgi:hypothetical protein